MILQSILILVLGYFLTLWFLRTLRTGKYDTKHVLITGCDTGFGNLLAVRLARLGFHVFAACYTEAAAGKLKDSYPDNITTVQLDVTDENGIKKAQQLVAKTLPKGKGLWAIVNNAGVAGVVSPFEWSTNTDYRQVMDVNFFGVVFVTRAFLPLVRKEAGRIINMSSICGRFAIGTGTYSASKYAVEGFSDSLRRDLYKTGVSVHVVEPGFFRTGIVSSNSLCQGIDQRFSEAPLEVQKYYGVTYMDDLKQKTCRFLELILSSKIHKVVDSYEHAVTARFPKARYVVGLDANVLFRFLWNLPEWLVDYLLCLIIPTPEQKHM